MQKPAAFPFPTAFTLTKSAAATGRRGSSVKARVKLDPEPLVAAGSVQRNPKDPTSSSYLVPSRIPIDRHSIASRTCA